ncbi:hypothetical protein TIFTF001_024127 [Ficus carica]|uniref:Uncharacterized protein n=1 Tax=Ficus carica TaxID=3494 RepID=A0AA88AMU0_FICCA|nr:hypothetical protein TIFTF001_024127 [Ficus carica]
MGSRKTFLGIYGVVEGRHSNFSFVPSNMSRSVDFLELISILESTSFLGVTSQVTKGSLDSRLMSHPSGD